jgi:hypothetical protein
MLEALAATEERGPGVPTAPGQVVGRGYRNVGMQIRLVSLVLRWDRGVQAAEARDDLGLALRAAG